MEKTVATTGNWRYMTVKLSTGKYEGLRSDN